MGKKKQICLIASLMTAMMLSACNQTTEETDTPIEETTYLGQVTDITDNTIMLALGTEKEIKEPASTESNVDDQQEPPSNPPATDGNQMKQPSLLDLTGEEVEINTNEETEITIESSNEKGTLSDIKTGDVLSVTCEDNEKIALTITIKSFETGGPEGNAGGPASSDSQASDIELTGVYTVDGTEESSEDETITSTEEDQNAVLVKNSGNLTLNNATITKSGDTSDANVSNFYALNSIIAATSGSTLTVSDSEISSDSEGSNGIFATGENAKITVSNVTIHTTKNSSRGLDATYNGTIIADNVDITTEGAHSAALATDRGEGTITVSNGTLSTAGDGSPCIYSTGNITATKVTGNAGDSQTAVIEGKNSITLKDSDLTGAGKNGVMLYQSTSGDAAEGTSVFNVTDSKLTTTSTGPMFYVTNTTAEVNITNTELSFKSDLLIEAAGNDTNNWGTPGSNGGNLTFTANKQKLTGNITCDSISSVAFTLKEGSTYVGAIDSENTGDVAVSLDEISIWNVAEDSYITSLTNEDTKLSNINSNGYTIYYDATDSLNEWLDGKTIKLQGDGKLTPAK